MKTFSIIAAVAAAVATSVPAFAQDAGSPPSAGHYEWRAPPQFGPRAPLRAPVRVWVPASADQSVKGAQKARPSKCDCPMMHGSADKANECMKMDNSGS